jgi:hypothetical protein
MPKRKLAVAASKKTNLWVLENGCARLSESFGGRLVG